VVIAAAIAVVAATAIVRDTESGVLNAAPELPGPRFFIFDRAERVGLGSGVLATKLPGTGKRQHGNDEVRAPAGKKRAFLDEFGM
jgi:hypothetical protein